MSNSKVILKIPTRFQASIESCEREIAPLLQRYLTNFPDFTDHSIDHSKTVLNYAINLLGKNFKYLHDDEKYILVMSCYLHDIGMSPTNRDKKEISKSESYKQYIKEAKDGNLNDYIRQIHHKLSHKFIMENWRSLEIINKKYAEAIALVCIGHRIEDLLDWEVFKPKYFAGGGTNYICIPFLAGLLRLADELDITNDRVPDLLFNKYLPLNKISKREWEKHRANYQVNFEKDIIIVESECKDRVLYDSLLMQCGNIQSELNYFHKIIRYLPCGERKLNIDYYMIEKNITTVGFKTKDIKFTFDLNEILRIFVGKRLYPSKDIAIREALQNSIDTCRLKKKIYKSFSPDISVCLDGNHLIIEDNGMGMDESVVENYFANLGHSFYNQKSILAKYEAIGDFGIGVLSYFLLCDFFEVETKMGNKESLKFRVAQESGRNFFFYEKAARIEPGTKITFFLKEPLFFDDLKNKIEHYIRFVEIPIKIREGTKQIRCISQQLELSLKEELEDKVKVIEEDVVKRLVLIKEKVETENFSGICGLISTKGKDKAIVPLDMFHYLREPRDLAVSVCHKGIFVNDFFANQNFFGKINIKRKQKLNLSRTSIIDTDHIRDVISDFQVAIFSKLFSSWHNLDTKRQVDLTKQCIESYLLIIRNCHRRVQDLLIKNFVVTIYKDGKKHHISLENLLQKKPRFILSNRLFKTVWVHLNTSEKKLLINSKLPIFPVIYSSIGEEQEFYLDLLLDFETKIKCEKEIAYYVIYPRKARERKEFAYRYGIELLEFEEPYIGAYPGIKILVAFNSNHPLIQFFMNKKDSILCDKKLQRLVKDFFAELRDFIYYEHEREKNRMKKEFKKVKTVLSKVNTYMRSHLKLTKKDFPLWVQKKL